MPRRRIRGRDTSCIKQRSNVPPGLVLQSKAIILTAENLDKRHRQLNALVNEAIKDDIKFEDVKDVPEKSDPDRLFKIELASKLKNIDYMVETLKCGDSLYISRVLNKQWIYDDEFAHIFNPEYLKEHIFPEMSLKMKKKLISSILKDLKNEERAVYFYNYCLSQKLDQMAFKFLLLTSESFKISKTDVAFDKGEEYSKLFIANSLTLFEKYLLRFPKDQDKFPVILRFNHMYVLSKEKYLALLDNCGYHWHPLRPFGLRMSSDIMKKFKAEVDKNPKMYLNILNRRIIIRYTKSKDAKYYIEKLMPQEENKFWSFYNDYTYIFNIINLEERYGYVKKLFNSRFPSSEFEMSVNFNNFACYELMTDDVKEEWALRQVESKNELHGHGNDYIWYRYVNFEKAFVEIKRYIMITPKLDKRSDMLEILVNSAKEQRDMEVLLRYYHERHINEVLGNKRTFIRKVFDAHDIYGFDIQCWNAYNLLLYSIEVYNESNIEWENVFFRNIAFIYHILKNIELPEVLKTHIMEGFQPNELKHLKLNHQRLEIVQSFIVQLCVDKVTPYVNTNHEDEVKEKVEPYVLLVLDLLSFFNKTKEDCPGVIKLFIKTDFDRYSYHNLLKTPDMPKMTQRYMIRLLKNDVSQFFLEIDRLKTRLKEGRFKQTFKMNELLRKLKIYFADDIGAIFQKICLNMILDIECRKPQVFAGVAGIFQLASDDLKLDFMTSYTPEHSKMSFDKLDETTWFVQEAICRFACYSRTPVPLANMLEYIKGDYLKYCLSIFDYYMAHLTISHSTAFIEATLKCPLSVQKHAIRLAFKSFSLQKLVDLLKTTWKNTKNVSLRKNIFKSLSVKVETSQEPNDELFQLFLDLLLDVHAEDDENVFNVITNFEPHECQLPKYLETAWRLLDTMPEKNIFFEYRSRIIKRIASKAITTVSKEMIMSIINKHIETTVVNKNIRPYDCDNYNECDFIVSCWCLTERYLVAFDDEETINSNLNLLDLIMINLLDQWNQLDKNEYTVQMLLKHIISELQIEERDHRNPYVFVNPILERALKHLQNKFPITKIYNMVWNLRLSISFKKAEYDARQKFGNEVTPNIVNEIASNFSKDVVFLVEDSLEKNEYFRSYANQISDMIFNNLNKIHSLLNNDTEIETFIEDFVDSIVNKSSKAEINILGVFLLPGNVQNREILLKLYNIENYEVKALLYDKFFDGNPKFADMEI